MGPVSGSRGSHGGKPLRRGSGGERMLQDAAFDPELLYIVGDEEGRGGDGRGEKEGKGNGKGKGVKVTGVYVEAEEAEGV